MMKVKKGIAKKRKKREPLDLDINSLLDILVILLVFLLKSYNPSDLFIDLPQRMKLPPSETISLGRKFVTLKVLDEKNVWVEFDKVDMADQKKFLGLLKQERDKIPNKKDQKFLNLVMDTELPYEVVKKVMDLTSDLGFEHFKLIVQGKDA